MVPKIRDQRAHSKQGRRYPRLSSESFGAEASAQLHCSRDADRQPFAVSLCNLSPEGACIQLTEPLPLARRDSLTLELDFGSGATLNLPARVAWVNLEGAAPRVGVRLYLERAEPLARTRYARWIVSALQRTL